MTAEMAAAAAALFDERKLLGGIYASAEAALDIDAVLALTLIGAEPRAQGIGRTHHTVFPRFRTAAEGQLVRADKFGGQELGEQRHPLVAEMEMKQTFPGDGSVEMQILSKCCADGGLYVVGIQCAGTFQGCREPLFPRCQQRRFLPQNRPPACGLEGIDELVLTHPLLP